MTGWEHSERLIAVWGLQSFSVQFVHFEERKDRQGGTRTVKVIGLEDRRGHHVCPQCGQQHAWGVQQETEPRRWRDCSLGDFEIYVEVLPWRVACCGGTRVESFPWEATGHRMTKRFFERIAALCTRLPISEVAEMMHLSWDTVCRVDKEAIQFALGDPSALLEGLRWIGVDEVSWTGGHAYFTIVTDLEHGRVVWIGEGKGEAALNAFFDRLGKKGCRKIKGVVSDLATGYLLSIAARIPQALHVLDRFHIVKWLNEALNDVRRSLFGRAPKDDLGRTLKVKKWLLLSAYERLELPQKRLLRTLMKLNRPLYRCHLLKERFRALLHHSWAYLGALRRNLTAWCRAAIQSRIEPMKVVGRRIRAHIDKVLAAYRAPVLMGYVESMNGNIVGLRREAHGYRDPDYYKLKIYQRCSLPHNPWSKIVL